MKKLVTMVMVVVMMLAAACVAENPAPRDALTIRYCYSQDELLEIYKSIDCTVYEGEEARKLKSYNASNDGSAHARFIDNVNDVIYRLMTIDADDNYIVKNMNLWVCVEECEITGLLLSEEFYSAELEIDVVNAICAYYDWHI